MKTGITAARAIGVTCKQIVATLSATVAVAIVTGGAAFQYLTHKTSLIDQIFS